MIFGLFVSLSGVSFFLFFFETCQRGHVPRTAFADISPVRAFSIYTDMDKAEMLKIIYNHVKLTMYLASLGWKTTPLRDFVSCLTLDSCKIVKEETKNKE